MPSHAALLFVSGVTALPGYFIADTPWAGTKTNTDFATRTQDSTNLSGGRLTNGTPNQNNLYTNDHWFATGTYKFAILYATSGNLGIHNITGVGGTQTVDAYSATTVMNVYSEITGVAVTAGLKTVQDSMATKNASSSAYGGPLHTTAWIRTGA